MGETSKKRSLGLSYLKNNPRIRILLVAVSLSGLVLQLSGYTSPPLAIFLAFLVVVLLIIAILPWAPFVRLFSWWANKKLVPKYCLLGILILAVTMSAFFVRYQFIETGAIEKLRTQLNLKLLGPFNDGLEIEKIPNGTFGFVDPKGFDRYPVSLHPKGLEPIIQVRTNKGPKNSYLEVHRVSAGYIQLVGFVSRESLRRLQRSIEPAKIALYTKEYDEVQVPIAIPIFKINSIRVYDYRDSYRLELEVDNSKQLKSPASDTEGSQTQ